MKDILKTICLAVVYYGGSLVLAVAMISVFFLAVWWAGYAVRAVFGWNPSQAELKNLAKYHECLENNALKYGREEACQICSEQFGLNDNIHLCDPPERP